MKKNMLKKSIFVLGAFSFISQTSSAKNLCANCYWDTTCGSISTEEVASLNLVNDNDEYKNERYSRFYCDNGRTELGLLWTEGSCAETGGLSVSTVEFFDGLKNASLSGTDLNKVYDMVGKAECRFGN